MFIQHRKAASCGFFISLTIYISFNLAVQLEPDQIIRTLEHSHAIIRKRADKIIHVTFKEGIVLDVQQQIELAELYNNMCEGEYLPFLFDAMQHVTITKEAKEYAIKLEETTKFACTGVIVNNLAYRLIAEFYIKFNKPKKPFKIFGNKEEAIQWLLTFLPK